MPLAIQELDIEGSALDTIDNTSAWDRFIKIVIKETTPD